MKKFLIMLMILSFFSIAHADVGGDTRTVQSALTSTKSTTLAVSQTSTIYTLSFPIASASRPMAIMYKALPATSDTAIYFQQSFQNPTTEGSSDDTYLTTDDLDLSVTGGSWQMATIDTVEMTYGRFKIVGQGSNPATTTLQIKVAK